MCQLTGLEPATDAAVRVRADDARIQEVRRLRRENFDVHAGPDTRDGRQLVPGRSWAAWSRCSSVTASDGVPFEVINDNPMIGAVSRVLYKTSTGSCTLNFRIADKTGSTNWAATGAASITSLSALSATTTMAGASASGANTMAKSGTTDRILQIVPTSLSGTPVVSGYIFYTL